MRALDRKLLRDLRMMRGQALAVAAVVAAGVASSVMFLSDRESLRTMLDDYYDSCRFAQVFAPLKKAPLGVLQRVREIPGVAVAEARVVRDVTLDIPGLREPAVARLVGVPESTRPLVNDLIVRSGRYLTPGGRDEVLVSEAFARAHHLEPGGVIDAVINNRRRHLNIVGIALSPEYIYSIRGGSIFPDDLRFGVFWMSQRDLAAAFDMEGAFNDLVIGLARGAGAQEVIDRLDRILVRYGGLGAYPRSEQTSHWYLEGELTELSTIGLILPLMFAGVAAFLINIVVSRLVATQREQIGALKAFGYTRAAIGAHYVKMMLAVTALGVAAGMAAGAWLGWAMTGLYAEFFHFPRMRYMLPARLAAVVAAAAAATAILGALGAVRRAVSVQPAEAMRPQSPGVYHLSLLERLGLREMMPPALRMIVRHLERRPARFALSTAGIALAVSILVVGQFGDAIEFIMDVQFGVLQRQDTLVTFVEPRARGALHELERYPGVLRAEPYRSVAARLRNGHRTRRVGLLGLAPGAQLMRVVDTRMRPVTMPEEGLVLNDKLAALLDARAGDSVTVEVLEGSRQVRRCRVAAVVVEYLGTAAYMDLDALGRLLQEGSAISGVSLASDPARRTELYAKLKTTPGVSAAVSMQASRLSFEDTLGRSLWIMIAFLVSLAGVIAFGIVYNNARVALSERVWDLSTLRVLGFTKNEIGAILLGETALVTALAVPLGLALGHLFAHLLARAYDTELYRIPAVLNPSSYGMAAAVTLAATAISSWAVWRRLDRLDLVAVLKVRE